MAPFLLILHLNPRLNVSDSKVLENKAGGFIV